MMSFVARTVRFVASGTTDGERRPSDCACRRKNMEYRVPNFVSYEQLLQAVCCRTVSGRSTEDIQYIVELAETLCRLMREVESQSQVQ
jgi:hypothetical protein